MFPVLKWWVFRSPLHIICSLDSIFLRIYFPETGIPDTFAVKPKRCTRARTTKSGSSPTAVADPISDTSNQTIPAEQNASGFLLRKRPAKNVASSSNPESTMRKPSAVWMIKNTIFFSKILMSHIRKMCCDRSCNISTTSVLFYEHL